MKTIALRVTPAEYRGAVALNRVCLRTSGDARMIENMCVSHRIAGVVLWNENGSVAKPKSTFEFLGLFTDTGRTYVRIGKEIDLVHGER